MNLISDDAINDLKNAFSKKYFAKTVLKIKYILHIKMMQSIKLKINRK